MREIDKTAVVVEFSSNVCHRKRGVGGGGTFFFLDGGVRFKGAGLVRFLSKNVFLELLNNIHTNVYMNHYCTKL